MREDDAGAIDDGDVRTVIAQVVAVAAGQLLQLRDEVRALLAVALKDGSELDRLPRRDGPGPQRFPPWLGRG